MNYEILVNNDNRIDDDYYNEIIINNLEEVPFERDNSDIFQAFKIPEQKIYLEHRTKDAFLTLKDDLKKVGITFDICSGFLTFEQQENKYNDFLKRNGYELTKHRMKLPGYSEHHTGLAFDCDIYKDGEWGNICVLEDGSENEETKYIHNIIHEYGFILRFPKDKTNITKTQYEPWHFRYVGIELATKLYFENLTLEEYYVLNKVQTK